MGAELIQNTLRTITNIQNQKNNLQAVNEDLQQKNVVLEELYSQGFEEKQKYMEGAIWMGTRFAAELEGLQGTLDYLIQEF